MNIAAYCRVSTDKEDQLNSLEAQKKFFTVFLAVFIGCAMYVGDYYRAEDTAAAAMAGAKNYTVSNRNNRLKTRRFNMRTNLKGENGKFVRLEDIGNE
ncbi:MAG: hypothetical protein NC452_15590 [Eubacterium sp.]|nr:hypothetical protein [Eubacterium sp.]